MKKIIIIITIVLVISLVLYLYFISPIKTVNMFLEQRYNVDYISIDNFMRNKKILFDEIYASLNEKFENDEKIITHFKDKKLRSKLISKKTNISKSYGNTIVVSAKIDTLLTSEKIADLNAKSHLEVEFILKRKDLFNYLVSYIRITKYIEQVEKDEYTLGGNNINNIYDNSKCNHEHNYECENHDLHKND